MFLILSMVLLSSETLDDYSDHQCVSLELRKWMTESCLTKYAFKQEVRSMVWYVVGPLLDDVEVSYLLKLRNKEVFWEEFYSVLDFMYEEYPSLEIYFRKIILLSLDYASKPGNSESFSVFLRRSFVDYFNHRLGRG